jgi:hypothetical protein
MLNLLRHSLLFKELLSKCCLIVLGKYKQCAALKKTLRDVIVLLLRYTVLIDGKFVRGVSKGVVLYEGAVQVKG